MSYYILPKINYIIDILPKDSSNNICEVYSSHSLLKYYNNLINDVNNFVTPQHVNHSNLFTSNLTHNILKLDHSSKLLEKFNDIIKTISPYEYIFSKIPHTKYSVSKLKPESIIFYDFLEIIVNLDIFKEYKDSSIKTLFITKNNKDIIESFEIIRENDNNEIVYFDKITDEYIKFISNDSFDFIFFESNISNSLNEYIISLLENVMVILKNLNNGGNCVIKISYIFDKPIIDILFYLSSIFEKVYIFKPNTSNITTFEKYIICKNFQKTEDVAKIMKMNYYRIIVFLKKLENKNILSIINIDIPYYFIIKINDINNIIGQQQLEALDLAIHLFKNKNVDDKIELIRKTNIQKAILWCEKFKIPHNKFFEKTNIFLPVYKEEDLSAILEDNII
jgi:23S rRNA U2552 (ribose-2'-O)-methylase RlmE/FtsJ